MSEKICFVIMGYGKKTNPKNGKSLDLDKTYNKIIKPTVKKCGYLCVRSDEIKSSVAIDKNMYMLLLCADLVIADISTHNPNALYELGVRHGIRPFSTIILQEDQGDIPFDFNHNPINKYIHSGDDISENEVKRLKSDLEEIIQNTGISNNNSCKIDSPFYEYLKDVEKIQIPKNYINFIDELIKEGNTLWAKIQLAQENMLKKDFINAEKLWKDVIEINKTENYYFQQYALSAYKSQEPNRRDALERALGIITANLDPLNTKDIETLGITGAIYKNLYDETKDKHYLKKSLEFYEKGYNENYDYYNGENFALCNLMSSSLDPDNDAKIFYKFQAKKVAKNIIEKIVSDETRDDIMWIYATLSQCYLLIGEQEKSEEYENKFLEKLPNGLEKNSWQKDTFYQNRKWFQQAKESI